MPHSPKKNLPKNYAQLKGSERRPSASAKLLGDADPQEVVKLTISLRRRPDGAPVPDFDYFKKTPLSARRRMSQDDFAAKYGASPADVAKVVKFAESHGLTVVETHAARRTVVVTGTVAEVSEAFAVTLGRYQHNPNHDRTNQAPIETYRGRDGFIHVPNHLTDIIIGVFGLDNRTITQRNGPPWTSLNGDPPVVNPVAVATLTTLYNFPPAPLSINQQTIAIACPQGGYGGYVTSDLDAFFGVAHPTITPIPVDGVQNGSIEAATTASTAAGNNVLTFASTAGILIYSSVVGAGIPGGTYVMSPPTATTVTLGTWNGSMTVAQPVPALVPAGTNIYFNPDGETTQDICISAAASGGANVAVYFTQGSQIGWVDMIHRVVHPDAGDPACSVFSSSVYICDGDDPDTLTNEGVSPALLDAVDAAFIDAAIQGVTICIAAGDTGTNSKIGANPSDWGWGFAGDNKPHVQYPGSDPWVLSVGGTTVGGNAAPPPYVEYVWNDPDPADTSQWGTTAGGVSHYFPKPSYQNNAGVPVSKYDNTYVGRGVPDVAADASYNSGYQGIVVGGGPMTGNGTSASSPFWAGFIALLNANLGENLGFVNPTFYALGSPYFHDINPGAGPTDNSNSGIVGYPAGLGWDACTGWGTPNGTALLAALQAGAQKDCFIILDWSSFAKAGIDEMLATPAGAVFNPAFYVVADWFTPADLGVGTATPVQPTINISPLPSGITWQLVGGPTADGTPTVPGAPQRFTYTYQLSFSSDADFPPTAVELKPLTLSASITGAISGATVSTSAVMELTNQSAPFMVPGSTTWLSNDVRVFQVYSANPPTWLSNLGISLGNSGSPTTDATTLIQSVIQIFNENATIAPPNHPFDAISTDENTSALDTLQYGSGTNAVYNFAVARVRYQDPGADAENVRVFFRTFPALAISTAYEPTTTYRRWSDGVEFGTTIPLLGSQYDAALGEQLETVPFFAEPRVDATTVSMDTQTDSPNVQTIVHNTGGSVVYAYYGCWLDLNQPEQTPYPQTPSGDGPFTATPADPLVPILTLMANQHQCITAEIAFDPIPIPTGATPGTSTMLGQRNLNLGTAANPGDNASRLLPSPFQLRSTAAGAAPDQLMIDWGNTPKGSIASLYLPEANAHAIALQAATMYGPVKFTATDAHTLEFAADGITYVPIPANNSTNLAGLLSVELPLGIKKGQEFKALIRQLTSVGSVRQDVNATARAAVNRSWQRVIGSFQLNIPVLVKAEMLAPAEHLLSLFKWMEPRISKHSRWYPVFKRYLKLISERVQALGGNPGNIKPSPTGGVSKLPGGPGTGTGIGTGKHPVHGKPSLEFTGKVAGIRYDSFGDFEGFLLRTEHGAEHRFHGKEPEVAKLVDRAWSERIVIAVTVDASAPQWPRSIVFRRPGGHY